MKPVFASGITSSKLLALPSKLTFVRYGYGEIKGIQRTEKSINDNTGTGISDNGIGIRLGIYLEGPLGVG